MNKTIEYKLSNAWIWAFSIGLLLVAPNLIKGVDFSVFSLSDWILTVSFASFAPILAVSYRAKIIITNNAFQISREIFGGLRVGKSTPQRFLKVIHPQEDHQRGRLSFVMENGAVVRFDPENNWRFGFFKKTKMQFGDQSTIAHEGISLKESFWPVSQSIDFVKADIHSVAGAVQSEIERYSETKVKSTSLRLQIRNISHLKNVFPNFTNVPTKYLVLELNSEWSFILSNGFLCDGYDSLMYNITRLYGWDTIHMVSHDKTTTFLPGSRFHYRKSIGNVMVERELLCSVNDSNNWEFHESGERQSWENGANYTVSRKKDRLNEKVIQIFLKNLGINVYDPDGLKFPLDAVMVTQTDASKLGIKKALNDIMIPYDA